MVKLYICLGKAIIYRTAEESMQAIRFDQGVGFQFIILIRRQPLEASVCISTNHAEIRFLEGSVDRHCYGEQRREQQRRQGDGEDRGCVACFVRPQAFPGEPTDAGIVFHSYHAAHLRESTRPSSMRMIRSANCASSSLWVIITIVWEKRSLVIFKSPITSWLVLESRLPVGSSAKTIAGFVASARAIATRCC